MVVVVNYLNVIIRKVIDFRALWVESQSGELERGSANLFPGLFEVVCVEVGIPNRVNEIPRLESTDLSNHAGQ